MTEIHLKQHSSKRLGFLMERSMISFNTETLRNVFSAVVVPVLPGQDEWALHIRGNIFDIADLIRPTTDVDNDAHPGLETKGQKKWRKRTREGLVRKEFRR